MSHPTTYQRRQKELASQGVGNNAAQNNNSAPKQGIVTSQEANSRLNSARETLLGIQSQLDDRNANAETAVDDNGGDANVGGANPFTSLFDRINILRENLSTSQENERLAREGLANNEASSALNSIQSAEESGGSAESNLNAQGDGTQLGGVNEDPMVQFLQDSGERAVGIIEQQMNTLSEYRAQFNEYTQQDIDSIARTAERSVKRQLDENDRTKRAMEFAGVLGGRAQFAPTVQESIIADVVQDGLDRIEIINEKKNSAIREARKAEADFNIDLFEQQANLAKEYNNEIEETFSQINQYVRQSEIDERDRIDFRQQQEERSALILAGELLNATPEQIMQTASANGIDFALLSKAVNDAKFEQSQREFEGKSNALTLEQKRASINASNRSNQPKATENTKPMTVAEIKQFGTRNGWTPPQGMSLSTAQAINGGLMVLPEEARQEYSTLRVTNPAGAEQFLQDTLNNVADTSITDKLGQENMNGVKDLYEKAATEMGVTKLFNWGDFKEVAKTDEFKKAYKDIFTEQMANVEESVVSGDDAGQVNMFATDEQFLKDVLDRTLELNTSNNKRLKELEKAINNSNKMINSTPAVNF